MGSCHPGGWGRGERGPLSSFQVDQRRSQCSSLLKANSFLLMLSYRCPEAAPSLFLINKCPSCRAQEAQVPEETVPGESGTTEIEYWLFLESPGTEKLWATGSSCQLLSLQILLPFPHTHTEMLLSLSTVPASIYFVNLVDFYS